MGHYALRMAAVRTFAVIDFVLAAIAGLGALFFIGVLAFAVFWSGDTGQELAAGVVGVVLFLLPFAVATVLYLAAGIGLLRRRPWGYYLHAAGAVLAMFTVVGIVYTVFAIAYALRDDFKAEFFRL